MTRQDRTVGTMTRSDPVVGTVTREDPETMTRQSRQYSISVTMNRRYLGTMVV